MALFAGLSWASNAVSCTVALWRCAVLATGKTHTVMGTVEEPGLLIMAVHDVFDSISSSDDTEYLLRVSYIEIYNEIVQVRVTA